MYSNGSCGTVDISTVDGFTFQGVEGVKTNCGFYQRYPYQTSVLNSATEGVVFKQSFSRKLREDGLHTFDPGAVIEITAGFNIFDTFTDLERSTFAFGDVWEKKIPLNESVSGALSMTALNMAMVAYSLSSFL